jgi:hypothetical protein
MVDDSEWKRPLVPMMGEKLKNPHKMGFVYSSISIELQDSPGYKR